MRFGEPLHEFWAREVDAPLEAKQRAAEARADVAAQEQARRLWWQFTKRLNHHQQRQDRRRGVPR
jgi:hypothetical protein